jgi:hypothetical protein
MQKYLLIASFLTLGLATPVFAAQAPTEHFAIMDTVGNCAVVDTQPSQGSGLKILGNKGGYTSEADAAKAFGSTCKGKMDRI